MRRHDLLFECVAKLFPARTCLRRAVRRVVNDEI
jgi:hypothetical protein